MGISLRALAPAMGISIPSLFGYRSGKIPISGKAWSKLEQAESQKSEPLPPFHEEKESFMSEESTPYRFTPMAQQCQVHHPQDEGLKLVLERIAKALEKLVEIEEGRKP